MKWETGPNLGATDRPMENESLDLKKELQTAIYADGVDEGVKQFLRSIYNDKTKASNLSQALNHIGESIMFLAQAPGEIVPLLEKAAASQQRDKELEKKIQSLMN